MNGTIINLLIGMGIIGGVIFLVYKYYPKIEEIINNQLLASLSRSSDDIGGSQPLKKIFLGFKHSSVNDWLTFITSQEMEMKKQAFELLTEYVHQSPSELGAVTSEVVTAIVAFNYPESFASIKDLLTSARDHWGEYMTTELYYEDAAKGLVELDTKEAQKFLRGELEIVKRKSNVEDLQTHLIKALLEIEIDEELKDFWAKLLSDPAYSYKVKESILRNLSDHEDDIQASIIKRTMKGFVAREGFEINEDDQRILEQMIGKATKLIIDGDSDLWNIILEASERPHLEVLLVEIIADIASNESIKLEEELLAELLKATGVAGTRYREALAERYGLSKEEFGIVRGMINTKELSHEEDVIKTVKFKKTTAVVHELLEQYHFIEKTLINGFDPNNARRTGIPVITGPGELEKIYLSRSLASNANRSFLYVDAAALVSNLSEASKFKAHIDNAKPCVIYLDKIYEMLTKELSSTEQTNLKVMLKTINDGLSVPSTTFIANMRLSQEDIEKDVVLKQIFKENTKGNYWPFINIGNPDLPERKKIFNDAIKKLAGKRTQENVGADAICTTSEGYSMVEYVNHMKEYFESSLLVHGKLVSPAEAIKK